MGETDRESEAPSKRQSECEAEDRGVGHSSCERSQRSMPASEQIVCEIHSAEEVERSSCNADGCEYVPVHGEWESSVAACYMSAATAIAPVVPTAPGRAFRMGRWDRGAKNRPGDHECLGV